MYPATLLDPENTAESLPSWSFRSMGESDKEIKYTVAIRAVEATAPVQAGEVMGLGLSGHGESDWNARNLLMQTDTSKSSNWGSAEHLPIIPFCGFLTVYFFQGPRNWECFFFFLISIHRMILAGAFVPQPNMCCCSQKWRFLTSQQQTPLSTENKFCLFSETDLSPGIFP